MASVVDPVLWVLKNAKLLTCDHSNPSNNLDMSNPTTLTAPHHLLIRRQTEYPIRSVHTYT